MSSTLFAAANTTVSGGVSLFGIGIPAIAVIAFLLGIYVGKKVL